MTSRRIGLVGLGLLAGGLFSWWICTMTPDGGPRADRPTPMAPADAERPPAVHAAAEMREPVSAAPAPSLPVRDIEVLVHDERGQPVPRASLVLSRDGEEWLSESDLPAHVVGVTDAAGRAVLRDVQGDLQFVAAVKVPVGASAFGEPTRKGRVHLTIAACDTEIRGRVVDHLEQGVAGFEVELRQHLPIICGVGGARHEPEPTPGAEGSPR